MTKEELKARALSQIEAHAEELQEAGRYLFRHPEAGYREVKTAAFMQDRLARLGLSVESGLALTGLRAKASGRSEKASVAVMGELDSVIMPGMPGADPVTGAFHGCGHHAQLTTVLGAAIGLVGSGVLPELDGSVSFLCVPAEEVIELEYRRSLIDAGKVGFLSGKQEFIRLGVFDGMDAVLMSHIMGGSPEPRSWVGHSWNGILHKAVRFRGRAAHAGLAPENGINALEAALCAMNNINALRESFRDDSHVRIHYIITKGGDSPNVVPDDVRMEFGVRAADFDTMIRVSERVNNALRAGAMTVGAEVTIDDSAGAYMPCHQSDALAELYLGNAREVLGDAAVTDARGRHRGSSTDCGDVASLVPLIHPYFGGAVGAPHGSDFAVKDEYAAYVVPAKLAAMTVIDLLFDGAGQARAIREGFRPVFADRAAYLDFMDRLTQKK